MKGKDKMRLEFSVLAGEESKKFLISLKEQLDRMERLVMQAGGVNEKESSTTTWAEDESDAADEMMPPKAKRGTKKAATSSSFDDEGVAVDDKPEVEDNEWDADQAEEEAPPKKAAKAKKYTIEDANTACRERCGRTNRAEVLGLMKKKFGVKSVTELDETDFAEFVKVMSGK
jgi:hypothetical protein